MTGLDSRSAMNPSRTLPAITAISPTSSASELASAQPARSQRGAAPPPTAQPTVPWAGRCSTTVSEEGVNTLS